MPLNITFTLNDDDLERFQAIVDRAQTAVQNDSSSAEIEAKARQMIAETSDLPGFITQRMRKLGTVIDMCNDSEWQLSSEDRRKVLSALAYLVDAEDLIPDHIPGLGFLDDAIYAELVLNELGEEISLYEEFCAFRASEEKRRSASGEDATVGREEWLADKRAVLHARRQDLRASITSRLSSATGGNWRIRIF